MSKMPPPRLKILHVCDSVVGGTGTYLAELLTLQAEQHGADRITLLMPREHREFLEPRLVESGIRLAFFRRPGRWAGIALLSRAYQRLLRTLAPDVVHAHSFGAGVATRRPGRRRPRALIYCPHGWAFDMDASATARRVIVAIERGLARRTDRILLISHHELASARKIGIASDRLVAIRNGVDPAAPAVAPAAWHESRFKLLFVGRFDKQKGLDILLDAVRPLGGRVALRVVGAPVVSGGVTAEQLPFVEYLGWRDRNEVAAQMKACDALIVPSRWEGFGLVAIEAMRLGKPIIASNVGGLAEITDQGQYGFAFPPNDPSALSELLRTIEHTDLHQMATRGHARFHAEYTASRMASQVDGLYAQLTSTEAN